MFVDTSALVEIIAGLPKADYFANLIETAAHPITSPVVRLETCMVLTTRLDTTPAKAQQLLDRLIAETQMRVVKITDRIGMLAVAAFASYGKGSKTRAKLNLADCFSYACAKAHEVPLLFLGNDFTYTDVEVARPRA